MNKIIVGAGLNSLEEAEREVQEKIDSLGDSWRVVSATTTGIPYQGGQSAQNMGPYQGNTHIMYVVTVSMSMQAQT